MNRKLISLLFSILGTFFLIMTGILIAEQQWLGVILSLLAHIVTIGVGFIFKKKWREADEH